MSHPKGEHARLDTLPQRLSGLGSPYVALAMSHQGGKDHLYEQSEKVRHRQLPVSRRPFTHNPRSTAAGFCRHAPHATYLWSVLQKLLGLKARYGI
jgi:hypothetical protein